VPASSGRIPTASPWSATAPAATSRRSWRCWRGTGPDPRDPAASPLLAPDHSGLPPALIQVAEHDPLRDDGLRYAAALEAAGVPVRTTVYYGMPHGFLAFPRLSRSAPQALGELTAALSAGLAGAS
jgi:acetyl esterase/lipase